MAADSANDLELALKKRARRRLVGAIALVLLMVIVLPMVLQDRAALAPQEAIKITMPNDAVNQQVAPVEPQVVAPTATEPVASEQAQPETIADPEAEKPAKNDNEQHVSEPKAIAGEKKPEVKTADTKKSELKLSDAKASEDKKPEIKTSEVKTLATSGDSFTIQVGVFSEMANVKQLQARLKDIGLDSHTENITTPKGEKIRLRAGHFNSRQEAAYALTKLQAADLTGMVISDK